jgi:hypothetical protein
LRYWFYIRNYKLQAQSQQNTQVMTDLFQVQRNSISKYYSQTWIINLHSEQGLLQSFQNSALHFCTTLFKKALLQSCPFRKEYTSPCTCILCSLYIPEI